MDHTYILFNIEQNEILTDLLFVQRMCWTNDKFKFIIFEPSIQSPGYIFDSIPADTPILKTEPTGWNSLGTDICIQISGCLVNWGMFKR